MLTKIKHRIPSIFSEKRLSINGLLNGVIQPGAFTRGLNPTLCCAPTLCFLVMTQ